MLKSKFDREPSRFCAQKIFTDRKEPGKVFEDNLAGIREEPLKVITYYGKGGIGKTRLLKELYSKLKNSPNMVPGVTFHPMFISLDAYDYANPINILTAIRNNVKADCSLFDYAMMQYCAKAKLNIEDIKDRKWKLSNNVLEHINDILALTMMNAAIPVKWIGTAIDAIKEQQFKTRYRQEIQALATLNEFEIFERLPYYLGLCLRHASMNNCIHVIFMDSYESLLLRTFSQTPSVECDEWVRELVLSSERIRLVIATRDKLKWEEKDPEWAEYLDQHLLKNLSNDDARWFLQQAPVNNGDIVDFIVENSKGIPLYLDMCVDVYESLFNTYGDSLTKDIYQQHGNFYNSQGGLVIIDRYLRHLTTKQQDAIKVLSVLHSFSRPFAMKLLQQMNNPCSHEEMTALLDKSIILPIDEESDIWKLDESIREHIWCCLPGEMRAELINNVLTITAADVKGHFFAYFAIVLEHIIANPQFAEGMMEALLAQVEIYANGGFWNELHGLLSSQTDNPDEKIQAIAVIGEAICLRRFGRLDDAKSVLDNHPLNTDLLGHFYYYYAFLKASIIHLQGHYDQAISEYAAIIRKMELVRGTLPIHIYIQTILKNTDLLMLRGRFAEALEQIDKVLVPGNQLTVTDQVEALRIKGHVYRFMQQFEEARTIYEYAMVMVRDSEMKASIGKLYTNYVETNCFDRPAQAIAYLNDAIEYNHDNDIELSKCYAAASIAWCRQGDMIQAAQYASLSYKKAEMSGYRSGMVFALGAKSLLDYASDDRPALMRDLLQMDSLTEELGVYKFIPAVVRQLCDV